MKKTESIEKDALTEMMSPSVSPSAARDAEVKKSVEMPLQDFTPKNRIADSVIDEEAVAETQSIAEAKTVDEEPPIIQRRVSSKQRKLSLEEYRNAYLKVPTIIDRKLDEQTKVLNSNFSAISDSIRDVKAIVNKSQLSGEVLNSLADLKQIQVQKSDELKTLVQKLKTNIEDGVHNFKHHRIGFETPFVCWTIVIETALILGLFTWIIISEKPNQDRIDNDLKYRYIKMKGDASAEQIATLEDIFELNRNNEAIEQMREDVETYEEAVRKQAALAEQARLKEQAAKEQESKAKSIKARQEQPKDNPNKKSKP